MAEKLIESITVKLSDASRRFVVTRSAQLEMESPGEYIRYLIAEDERKARSNLKLLADALGVKVDEENLENR